MVNNQGDKTQVLQESSELHAIAARLAGIKSVLTLLGGKSSPEICDSLFMVADMVEHLNERLCSVADRCQ